MPRHSRVPCVVTVHDMTFFDHPEWHEPTKVRWFRSAIRYSVGHAAAIICVSETTAGRLREVLSPRCPVIAIPHGVDHSRFVAHEPVPGSDREILSRPRTRSPLPVASRDLGAAQRESWTSSRPLTSWLPPGPSSTSCSPVGPVGRPRRRWRRSRHAHAGERIRRLGYVPDEAVPALLRGAHAVVYPSLEEGFGLPALEALACGAPLVTTAGTAMAELAGASAVLAAAGSAAIASARGDRSRLRGESSQRVGESGESSACRSPPVTPGEKPAPRPHVGATVWRPGGDDGASVACRGTVSLRRVA